MRIAFPLLALAACSAPSPSNETATAAPAAVATAAAAAAAAADGNAATPATGAPVAPRPGDLKTFKDWTVGCDNARRCTMASLGPEMGDFPPYTMQVARAGGPGGGYEIAIDALQDDATAPATIVIDAVRIAIAPHGFAGSDAARVATAMANGKSLVLLDPAGARIGTISLAGASAALRYIDAAQGRAGTVTATVARGSGVAASVSSPPALPVIVAPRLDGTAAKPTAAQLATMRKTGECEDRMTDASIWQLKTAAVGGGTTLVLLPCSAGAYNEIDALFVIRDGKVAPADVDAPSGFEETGADSQTPVHSVINGTVENGMLTSYAKGRGLGDCGVSQRFVWDGTRLRLVEQSAMGECRGNPNYITTWRARVERR